VPGARELLVKLVEDPSAHVIVLVPVALEALTVSDPLLPLVAFVIDALMLMLESLGPAAYTIPTLEGLRTLEYTLKSDMYPVNIDDVELFTRPMYSGADAVF